VLVRRRIHQQDKPKVHLESIQYFHQSHQLAEAVVVLVIRKFLLQDQATAEAAAVLAVGFHLQMAQTRQQVQEPQVKEITAEPQPALV
jgi:hypothetical protein